MTSSYRSTFRIALGVTRVATLLVLTTLTTWAQPKSDPAAKPIATGNSEVAKLLRKWYADGTAAGNVGDFYDNRDGGHSQLNTRAFPQLSLVELTPAEKAQLALYKAKKSRRRAHWGLLTRGLYRHVTFGNSSTASSPPLGCSNARFGLLSARATAAQYMQYTRSHLYVYPEHLDHDPGRNGRRGWGDLYHANVPYFINSQGSSGSDKVFLRAIAHTLAAFRPDVKKQLVEKGLLMPTVQYVLRRSMKHVKTDADYLSGPAHPSVFDGKNVDALRMVKLAHEMRRDAVPPMIRLAVIDEDEGVVGRDYFEGGKREKVFDTPASICRIGRSLKYTRRMVVSALGSFDAAKRPLSYHWVVLRGDARRIRIKRLNKNGSEVELLVPHHERMPVPGNPSIESNRVDIGAFVRNGQYYSAPGFVTFYFPDDEARTYTEDGRLIDVAYGTGDTTIGYYTYRSDGRYDITDWRALVYLLADARGGFSSRVLRKQFKRTELKAFDKVKREFDAALIPTTQQQKAINDAEAARKKAKAAVTQAKKKVEETVKARDRSATDERNRAAAKAEADLKKAEGELSSADSRLRKARDVVKKIPAGALKDDRRGLGGKSALVRIEDALNALKNDVRFCFKNAKGLDALYRGCADPQKKKAFLEARSELDSQFKTRVKGKLTKYERNRIEWLNLEVLQSVVYPDMLKRPFKRNFVDWRLASQKSWRDVYHYDKKNRLLGWTRHLGDKTEEFTRDGARVVEKDELGRPAKARTVKYVVNWERRKPSLLRQQPGDEMLHYAYESDTDRLGKIAKREKLP